MTDSNANASETATLTANSASALQQALQGLVFTPTAHQSAAGQTLSTTFKLAVNDGYTNIGNFQSSCRLDC